MRPASRSPSPRSRPYWRKTADLITPAQRDELFDSFRLDAFHLELRDDYGSPVEDAPYTRWQRGEPDDYTWLDPWMGLMKRATGEGKTVRRVRVITQPHSRYVGWEHSLTHLNRVTGCWGRGPDRAKP